jgi:hypothetical protein
VRWFRRRPKSPRRESCEICGARPKRVYEISADITAAVPDLAGTGGGAFMTATYCKEHRPPEAVRKPNQRR